MSATPEPGRSVRGSSTGRPVMALLDLVGRRWSLRILWELHRAPHPPTFRELRTRCDDMSSSLLTRRLRELSETHLVERAESGYALTDPGERLLEHLRPLAAWADAWAAEFDIESRPPGT
ncbi:winged helix-turn-helix transcriptional regulator [Nocardia sp. NBC_01329]|uniref:winged helix-turn-helix transcriptional regulator n=1 Tax=Nocardia sp. NBC_01329 TaxID=2903594 RepID=UPI002E0FEA46|nr:helix-turn-helix transcriptional regulator [Nocardia sp. NBC_01329]